MGSWGVQLGVLRDAGGAAGVALREAPSDGKASRYLERADAILAGGGLGAPRVSDGGRDGITSVRTACRSSSGVGEYQVEVRLSLSEGVRWSCSCPLTEKESESVCKHALALLLFCEGHFEEELRQPDGGRDPGEPPLGAGAGPSPVNNWTQELIDGFLGKPQEGKCGGPASAVEPVRPPERGDPRRRGARGEAAPPTPGRGPPHPAAPAAAGAPAIPAARAGRAAGGPAGGPGAGPAGRAAAEAPAADPPPAKKARKASAKDRLASLGLL